MSSSTLRAGIAGLGMAGADIVGSLAQVPGVELVAAADPRRQALAAFADRYGGRTHTTVEALCADPDVDAVWVATPTHLHREHAVLAAARGKHVVVEKPFAVSLEQCDEMIDAAERHGVTLLAGGARSFDPAVAAMRRVVSSGRLGALRALTSWAMTGWVIRPREPHEVDESLGGGALFNQAPHSIDVVRLLGGGMVRSVRGMTGQWMPERPSPGYFAAYLEFEDGVPATVTYNGYGYMLGWELVPWGESPERRAASERAHAYRRSLRDGTADEPAARERLRFGGGGEPWSSGDTWVPGDAGLVVASCERGEVRQSPTGIYVYDDGGRVDEALAPGSTFRGNEVGELRAGVDAGRSPLHDGRWGRATMEVLLAILRSATEGREITLEQQVPAPPEA